MRVSLSTPIPWNKLKTAEDVDNFFTSKYGNLWVPQRTAESYIMGDIYTPRTFAEYIGQKEAKELAQIMIEAANLERRRLPNIMISGEYGLGKSSLARLIVVGVNQPLRVIDAVNVNKIIPDAGTIIIDEIHNLDSEVADSLNLYLDRGELTIIGCTTDPGKLPAPFRSRFRNLHLTNYTNQDLMKMLKNVCDRKNISLATPIVVQTSALFMIAERSRNNARASTSNLAFIFDLMTVQKKTSLTNEVVREGFQKLGIDDKGYQQRDYKIMSAIPSDRPVGLQYLAAITGIDEKTIEEEIEPYLLRTGKLDRTARGRIKISEI